jgi:hypothetical protein
MVPIYKMLHLILQSCSRIQLKEKTEFRVQLQEVDSTKTRDRDLIQALAIKARLDLPQLLKVQALIADLINIYQAEMFQVDSL